MKKRVLITAVLALSVVALRAEVVTIDFSHTDFATFVDGNGPFTIQNLAGIANGEGFTFDLTVSAVSGNGDGYVDFSSQRPLLDADSGVTRANSLTITVSDLQLAAGQTYGGIVAVDRYDNLGGDDWVVNGETISDRGNNVALGAAIMGPMTITAVDDGSNGNSRLEGFDIEVIPEPATLGMVAAFGGAILFIRRKLMM